MADAVVQGGEFTIEYVILCDRAGVVPRSMCPWRRM